MAKKKKGKNKAPSQRRQKQLLRTRSGSQGQKLYKVTPSNVKQSEIKWMATTINRRLRALEKAGLTEDSQEYNMIKHYATGEPNGKGSIYNVNMDKGTIRITSDTRKMTSEERAYLVTVMRNIMRAKTSTVRGTRAAKQKGYETFMRENKELQGKMTFDKYDEMWKRFRQNVDPDRKDKAASQKVVQMLKETNFYDMTLDDMEQAFQYMATFEDPADWADAMIEAPFGEGQIRLEFT